MKNNTCSLNQCNKPHEAKGFCRLHYVRWKKFGDPTYVSPSGPPPKVCSLSFCETKSRSNGLCSKHFWRWRKYGDPLKTVRHGVKNKNGYILILMPNHPNARKDGYILEHRLVMSDALARPLTRFEEIHHKNGDRSNNRIENLELWTHSQPPGGRVEDKVAWAIQLLQEYKPEALAPSCIKLP
jgi:hypothetical protein